MQSYFPLNPVWQLWALVLQKMGILAKSISLSRKQLPGYINKRSKINILQQKIKGTSTTRGGRKIKSCLNLNSTCALPKYWPHSMREMLPFAGERKSLQIVCKTGEAVFWGQNICWFGLISALSTGKPNSTQVSARGTEGEMRKEGRGDSPRNRLFRSQGEPRSTSATQLPW